MQLNQSQYQCKSNAFKMHKRRDSYMAYGLNKYGKTSHMYRLLSLAEIVLTEPEMTEKKTN